MIIRYIERLLLIASLCVSTASLATVITDVEEIDTYINWFESTSWTHDITDHDFIFGSAVSGTLSIEFRDDGDSGWFGGEWATVVVGTIDFQDGTLLYKADSTWAGNLGINSLAALNSTGLLDVTVWSDWGDFEIGNSTLEVVTLDIIPNTNTAVPEPSTFLLLAVGVVGLGVCRRTAV